MSDDAMPADVPEASPSYGRQEPSFGRQPIPAAGKGHMLSSTQFPSGSASVSSEFEHGSKAGQ